MGAIAVVVAAAMAVTISAAQLTLPLEQVVAWLALVAAVAVVVPLLAPTLVVVAAEVGGTSEQGEARVILGVPQALQHIVAKQLFPDALMPLQLLLVGQLQFHGVLNEEERRITGGN